MDNQESSIKYQEFPVFPLFPTQFKICLTLWTDTIWFLIFSTDNLYYRF